MIPLLVTVFIDSLGFGIVFPIFSPLIVGNEGGFFESDVSLAIRGLLFGILVSVYCFGTFLGGPILGALSDRKGRRKLLIGSVCVAFIGYFLAYLGVAQKSLWLLFTARLLNGLAAGNYGVALSAIADTSLEKDKVKNFGLVGMSWGSGFIIGPYLGGKCALLGFEAPFVLAAFVCLINLWLLGRLKETLAKKVTRPLALLQLKQVLAPGPLRGIFLVSFLFSLGWGFFTEFSPIFLTRYLTFDLSQIANFYAWVGLWVAVSQGWLIRPLIKKFLAHHLLAGALVGLGLLLPIMLFVKKSLGIFAMLPLIAFAEAFITPTSTTLVSNFSPLEQQGKMLGVHNSVQSIAIGLSPLFSGSLVALYPHLPVTISSVCMLMAFGLFLLVSRKTNLSAVPKRQAAQSQNIRR